MGTTTGSAHVTTGAYVLDALSSRERRDFERHLRACGDCQHDVQGFFEAAGALSAYTATQPPPEVRPRVLGVVGGDGGLRRGKLRRLWRRGSR